MIAFYSSFQNFYFGTLLSLSSCGDPKWKFGNKWTFLHVLSVLCDLCVKKILAFSALSNQLKITNK